jgi:UDP-N-acetylmuramyl tripeptide synthase
LKYRGADIILDFAHNPDGVKRLIEMAIQWSAKRKFIVLGQAGDRDDDQIQGMAREAVNLKADRYYLKALPKHQYERDANDVVELLRTQLLKDGAPAELVVVFPDELTAIQNMLAEAKEGDLLLVLSHEELDAVIPFLESSGAIWA